MSQPATSAAGTRSARRRQLEHSPGRFYGRTALGLIVPGAGLALRGKRVGWLLVLATLVGALFVIALALTRGLTRTALWLAVRPNALLVLMVALIAWAAVVAASIAYTGWLHRPDPRSRAQNLAATGWVGLLCLVLVVPTVIGARDLIAHRDLLSTAFGGRSDRGAGAADPDASRSDPWEGIARVNVLLLGSDSGADRIGVRTDSIMLASIDTRDGSAVLFSLPRNLENVPFPVDNPLHALYPQGYSCQGECLLNAVWQEAELHPELFGTDPHPGLTTTRAVVAEILGLTVDATVVVDMQGFADLIDAVGGVDVTVRERIPTGGKVEGGAIVPGSITGWIEAGHQHLDGYHALWFARSRATTDDFSRMRRQRCLAGALISQVDAQTLLTRYPQIAQATKENLTIDIPLEDLPAWIDLLPRMQKAGKLRSLPFSNLNIHPGNPDFARIRAMVDEALHPAATTPSAGPSAGGPGSSYPTDPAGTTEPGGPAGPAEPGTPYGIPGSNGPEVTDVPAPGTPGEAPTTESLVNLSDAC